jgi:hypothetical protein
VVGISKSVEIDGCEQLVSDEKNAKIGYWKYPDHRADVAGRFLAVGGANVVLAIVSLYRKRHLLEDSDAFCSCDNCMTGDMGVDRGLDTRWSNGLRGLEDSA